MHLLNRSLVGLFGLVMLLAFTGIVATLTGTLIWIIWGDVAPVFFKSLPEVWLTAGWWSIVKLTWLAALVGGVIFKPSGLSVE